MRHKIFAEFALFIVNVTKMAIISQNTLENIFLFLSYFYYCVEVLVFPICYVCVGINVLFECWFISNR